jgi:dipeptidyl aminopeptidase/acylaminoacyl peptidase
MMLSSSPVDVPLIPRRILFGSEQCINPQISANGQLIAYLGPLGGVLNIWVRSSSPQETTARVITRQAGRDITGFIWHPSGEYILYAHDAEADENEHVFRVDVRSFDIQDLTPFQNARSSILQLHPNHPDHLLVTSNRRVKHLFDVYEYCFSQETWKLLAINPGDITTWVADHNLQIRAAVHVIGDRYELRVRDTNEEGWRTVYEWDLDESPVTLGGFTSDGKRIQVFSSVGSDTSRLLELDVRTGKTVVVAEDPEYDISTTTLKDPVGNIQAVSFIRERREWILLDRSLDLDFRGLQSTLACDFNVISRDYSDRRWIVVAYSDRTVPAYYLYERGSQKCHHLFSAIPELDQYPLASRMPFVFKARDGLLIRGYLTLPENSVLPAPTVLLVHSGPWSRDGWGYDAVVQFLANRGYVVLQINFRGSAGFGKKFLLAGAREWGGKMQDDLIDGINWAIHNNYSDSRMIAIMGTSYGGYAALAALTFTPDRFACGIAISAPSDLVSLVRSLPPQWKLQRRSFLRFIGDPSLEQEFLYARSPIHHIQALSSPLLICHGAQDIRVKAADISEFVHKARSMGKDITCLIFPDEGHTIRSSHNRLRLFAAVEGFLARHLHGRCAPL